MQLDHVDNAAAYATILDDSANIARSPGTCVCTPGTWGSLVRRLQNYKASTKHVADLSRAIIIRIIIRIVLFPAGALPTSRPQRSFSDSVSQFSPGRRPSTLAPGLGPMVTACGTTLLNSSFSAVILRSRLANFPNAHCPFSDDNTTLYSRPYES